MKSANMENAWKNSVYVTQDGKARNVSGARAE